MWGCKVGVRLGRDTVISQGECNERSKIPGYQFGGAAGQDYRHEPVECLSRGRVADGRGFRLDLSGIDFPLKFRYTLTFGGFNMSALAFGIGVLMIVLMPMAVYVMFEDILDFVEQDVLPFFRK